MGCRSSCMLWLAVAALAVLTLQLRSAAAAPMDLSNPVEHNHFLLLAPYGASHRSGTGADGENTARYVQLSNGSRFVCETASTRRREPLDAKSYPLRHQMESLMTVMRRSDHPCVHYAEENYVTVYCWDNEVREDALSENKGRSLGRRRIDGPQIYWTSNDAFGRYVATVYGDGDECPYDKGRRIETEVRFHCRYSEFENPIPYMSLHESSQCRYMLRLLSSKFCSVPQLDHPSEEETVRCQMLDD
ncbi:conserved hypothetical protein [Leishmania infantum JPCM5]|uniref:Uncharacterized protein n=2 Tax=Leishmania infantum TaxID=5671 RepID=A4IDU3_LEIIN|nr:conserved hypothetical protein [Leishmania infantum JPCM5]CAC9552364.1 hypothetical_protein_-_conserved [Leishmania infantum]CAM73028.1 conserved hypothetical protein [Leishmania infantum JPCM5]SUZ46925.1 hypothetical_protein_-_conserved [Leishmania infantum]|eukprot:XP_001469912.1 conserved hypothetical protein [Leishmania infantum JPCM5]